PVDVTVTRRNRSSRLTGVRVHRPTVHLDLGPVTRSGIPATNPLRTALDLGAVCPFEVMASVVEHLVREEALSIPALHVALQHHRCAGRGGFGPVRRVLDGR